MNLNKFRGKIISAPSLIVMGIFVATGLYAITSPTPNASAAPVTDFKPGRIIEDSVFTNSSSMNPQQIQSFLNSKVTNCDTKGEQRSEMNNAGVPDYNGNGSIQRWEWGKFKYGQTTFPCLKEYSEGGRVAAQIIYDVAQAYAINPQVLIALLQKEQSLVTDTWPSVIQYRSATGYGCPDTAACSTQYYGLTNQLTWAAKMFRSILNNSPNWYTPYNLGNNFIRWSPNSSCGGGIVYIENRSTQALYNYTPYQPNSSALAAGYGMGDGCGAYGNRNFYLYFRDWFGYNTGPAAFKTAASPTIYTMAEGYKLAVPYMAALQDYGISADSIQTVSQSYVDSKPTPPSSSGISNAISHVVKSPDDSDEDGGSVYLISRGKRYQFTSMSQFYSYGFKESDLSYLPLGYIFSIQSAGMASQFISSPYGSLFKIENNKKRLFFEYSAYISQNPSDNTTALSYFLADKINSGDPLTNRPILIQQPTGGEVKLYINNTYYGIPSYDALSCWGLNSSLVNVPTYRIPQSDYTAQPVQPQNISCIVNDGESNLLMSYDRRMRISATTTVTAQALNGDLRTLASKLPLSSNSVGQFLKSPDTPAVWFIDGTTKRVIPSYTTFTLMGLNDSNVNVVSSSFLNNFVENGIKLSEGQLVKNTDSAEVYVVGNGQRFAYDSSNIFEAYSNDWSNIETYSRQMLDQHYPYQGKRVASILIDKTKDKAYLVNKGVCIILSTDTLQAMGKTITSLKSLQPYDATIFKYFNLANCNQSSTLFVKSSSQSLVYWLDNGTKRPLNTYNAMLSKNGGRSPVVMTLENELIDSIATGTPINN